jgi:hypothetical protein
MPHEERAGADMSETAEGTKIQRRNGLRLMSAAAIAALCVLAIVAVRLVQRVANRFAQGRADEP